MSLSMRSINRQARGQDTDKGKKPFKILATYAEEDRIKLEEARFIMERRARASMSWSVYYMAATEALMEKLEKDPTWQPELVKKLKKY